ncbi:MAG: hypothetical protein RIS47_1432 [Bacteroidota bacterium]
MKNKFILIALVLFATISQAQVNFSEIALARFTDGDNTAVEESNTLFATAKTNLMEAESIEQQYAKYNNDKKRKKWESKTAKAKQARVDAQVDNGNAYAKLAGIYQRIIDSGTYLYEDDHAIAVEYLNEGNKNIKKAEARFSKYIGQKSSAFKKTEYKALVKDLEMAEQFYQTAFASYEEAIVVLNDQQQKKDKENAELQAWERAQSKNTIDGFKSYLSANPDGLHADEARAAISNLETLILQQAKKIVTYRVQLLADQKVWDKQIIAQQYPMLKATDIDEWFDDKDGLFKYCTAKFPNYASAREFKNKLKGNRTDVFVIAFISGYQVDITEAKTETNETHLVD